MRQICTKNDWNFARKRSRRPNHLRSQIGSPKSVRSVSFRRLPGGFHRVAKPTPFRIAFRLKFGGQNGPKIDEISSFGAIRFTSEFQAAKLVIFGGAQSWKSLILLRKNKVFRKIDLPLTGTIFGRFEVENAPKSIKIRFQTVLLFRSRFRSEFSWFSAPIWSPKTR